MKKKHIKFFFLLTIFFVILLISILHPILKRIDILTDYKQLLSNQDAMNRLNSIPPIRVWEHDPKDGAISIGYASFDFPFGEIFEIREESKRVFIDSDKAKVQFVFSLLDDFEVDLESPEKYLPALTFKGGKAQVSEEKYKKNDIDLWKLEVNTPTYEFKKKVLDAKPKSFSSVFFMDFDDLYIYEKLLEIKNAQLRVGVTYLFTTDNLSGMVQRQDRIEKENNYACCYMILICDTENIIYQLVQIISYMDEVTEQQIKQFVLSLNYDMEIIQSRSDDLGSVIYEALKDNEYYVPQENAQKLKDAQDALTRIDAFFTKINTNKESEEKAQTEATHVSYSSNEVYADYEGIKLASKEINTQEIHEIQAKAAQKILSNYSLFQAFNAPNLYGELEALSTQHKNSSVIKQCWIDGIESIHDYYFYKEQDAKIESLRNRFEKYMQGKPEGEFYEEAYAQVLRCTLNEQFVEIFLKDNPSLYLKENPNDISQLLSDYLVKISLLQNDVALRYEAKALRDVMSELNTCMDIEKTVRYCDRVIEIASKYPDDLPVQKLQCESIEDALEGLFWHPDYDLENVVFNKYYGKLEELAGEYQKIPKYDKLHREIQKILEREKRLAPGP